MHFHLLDSTSAAAPMLSARRRHPYRHFPTSSDAGAADRVRFWRPLRQSVIDVVFGEGTTRAVPLHTHEALQVLLPVSPLAIVDGTGRVTTLYPGQVHLTGPFELQGARSLDGAPFTLRMMLLGASPRAEGGRLRAHDAAPDVLPPRESGTLDDPALYAELCALFDALRGPLAAVDDEARLHECVTRLMARCAGRGSVRPVRETGPGSGVARVREHLLAHVDHHVTLEELADVAGLSRFYLLRAFRRAYGLTPHAYQMQLRLARARRLLAEGRPLSWVTYEAGFADQSHLTRRFKSFYGFTPALYARQLAARAAVHQAPDMYRATAPRPAA
jgi:AraC-like DNA-binding protein